MRQQNLLERSYLGYYNSKGARILLRNLPQSVTQQNQSSTSSSSNPSKIVTSGVWDLCIADHKLTYVKLKLKAKNPGFSIRKVRNYKNFDKQSFQSVLQESPWWITSMEEIRKEINRRYKLLKKCDGTAKTLNTWKECKKSRNEVTKMLRESETAWYWHKLFKNAKNPRDF